MSCLFLMLLGLLFLFGVVNDAGPVYWTIFFILFIFDMIVGDASRKRY